MAILGVDTGGTFTDFYLIDDSGGVAVHKRASTPDDPARAILDGIAELAEQIAEVVHGSTVATNAIIERKGARTALITTRGFRDVLVIGRQNRPKLYDLSPQREPPLVPDELRLEATERLDYHGDVLQAIDPAEIETLLDYVEQQGVESLAVCFLYSFVNAEHERMVEEAARRRGMTVSASYEVLPQHREYERTSTTVANAYVSPVMSRYLARLQEGLLDRGIERLRVMSSSGGSMSPSAAGRLAVRTAVSGPAGGVAGAFALAKAAGCERIVTLDMGGTSTDVSLCPARILETDETSVGGLPIRGGTVDVLSVGAGGGSIARIDAGGALKVGPESAGADPGPACYGKGLEPTVTDAQVALGRIAAEHFLGGRMAIRTERAMEALERISRAFGGDARQAAMAVLRVANANMEAALRVVSVERGFDPRRFTLVAFGGAGPLHACELAERLRIPRVLVPPYPGVLSALGMAIAPVVKEMSASVLLRFEADGTSRGAGARRASPLRLMRDELEARGKAQLKGEGFSRRAKVETVLDMRYTGQSYELPVRVRSLEPGVFLPLFHRAHRERYGHSDASRVVEVVNMRVKLVVAARVSSPAAVGRGPSREGRPYASREKPTPIERRDVWFGEGAPKAIETPFFDRQGLGAGQRLRGPAVLVQMDCTTVVAPGWRAEVDELGNLVMTGPGRA